MIRWKQVKELVIVDLLQTNRQANQNGKSNAVKRSNLWWRVLLQNGLFLFIYGVFFGTVMLQVHLPDYPGLLSQSLGFMGLFAFLQLFQIIFNLFFDNANLSEYLSLPFSIGELFLSKLMTILLNTASFFILPLVMLTLLGIQAGHPIVIAFLLALFITIMFIFVMILIPFVVIYLLHQIPFYVRHKKVMTTIIYFALFATMFFIFYTNEPFESTQSGVIDSPINPLFIGFYELFTPGSYLAGWLKFGVWALIALILTGVSIKWIIPQLYSEDKRVIKSRKYGKNKRKSMVNTQPKWKLFIKYQLRQLQETTFIIQMVFGKLAFPFFFIGPMLMNQDSLDGSILSELSYFWGIYLLIGALFALLSTGETTISGVIISFDKENFHYFKSLPLSFQEYMQFKFLFAFVVEWLLGIALILPVTFFINLPFTIILYILIGFTLGTFITSLYFFMRDYRLLNLNWGNFTELAQRGINQFLRIIFNMILVIGGMLGLIGLSFWLFVKDQPSFTITISSLITFILIGVAIGLYYYSKKKFWIHFH